MQTNFNKYKLMKAMDTFFYIKLDYNAIKKKFLYRKKKIKIY